MKQINEIDLNSYRDRVYQNAVNHGCMKKRKVMNIGCAWLYQN